MAVYTFLNHTHIRQLLACYNSGSLISYAGIADGIENSNYHIETTTGHYILTIFEHYNTAQLDYFLQLLHFFGQHGLPVPEPVPDKKQQILHNWQDKPLALFKRLAGKSILRPDNSHCRQIGTLLGRLHQIGKKFSLLRTNPWGSAQIQIIGKKHLSGLNKDDALLLSDELHFQYKNNNASLTHSVIHADLFCDNALFDNNTLSGIVDFYSACTAPLLFDLAICVNDWCINDHFNDSHYIDRNKAKALLNAYIQVRPLDDTEKQHWSTMLRAAALRFWLSRLSHQQAKNLQRTKSHLKEKKGTELTLDKDPDVLKCLLIKHRENITFCQSLIES